MPKHNPKVPGMRNGNSSQYVPPDIKWDENDPPVIFACSQHTEHHPQCERNCERMMTTEALVNLLNEARAWARIEMVPLGLPKSLANGPFNGVNIDILDTDITATVLKEIILEKFDDIDEEDINERFRIAKYNKLHAIRETIEPDIKQARLKAQLGVNPIIGPDGRPL